MVKNGIRIGIYDDSNIEELTKHLIKHISKNINNNVKDSLTFFCIGTDRSTGDSFGPFVGTMLIEKGYNNVIGTIDEPVHALNLDERIKEIPEESMVISIDTSLSKPSNVGKVVLNKGKLYPGTGVGKELTPVGDFNICGIVNESGYMEMETLMTTRLSVVLKLARDVVGAIEEAFPLINDKDIDVVINE